MSRSLHAQTEGVGARGLECVGCKRPHHLYDCQMLVATEMQQLFTIAEEQQTPER